MESDPSVRTGFQMRAVFGLYLYAVVVPRSIVCILPLQLHFGCGDVNHTDVKHCTGVWSQERKKGNLLMTIVKSSFILKHQSGELALLPSNELTKCKLQHFGEKQFLSRMLALLQHRWIYQPILSVLWPFAFVTETSPWFGGGWEEVFSKGNHAQFS